MPGCRPAITSRGQNRIREIHERVVVQVAHDRRGDGHIFRRDCCVGGRNIHGNDRLLHAIDENRQRVIADRYIAEAVFAGGARKGRPGQLKERAACEQDHLCLIDGSAELSDVSVGDNAGGDAKVNVSSQCSAVDKDIVISPSTSVQVCISRMSLYCLDT